MSLGNILIGKPRVYPNKLIKELRMLFLTIPRVKSAYIAQVYIPDSGLPAHIAIGIDMLGDLNSISERLEKVINNNICKGEYIDVFPSNTKGLLEYFNKTEPFYKAG